MNAGGLFALSPDEAMSIIDWYYAAADSQQLIDGDEALADRLREWLDRHSEATP